MPNPEFAITGTNTTPPGGWSYIHADPPATFKHYDYTAWLKSIQSFFEGNDIPMSPDWIDQLHSEACKQNPHWGAFCKHWTGERFERKPINLAVIMQFLKMLTKWAIKHKGELVGQEEATRRASICVQCPYNFPSANGCGSCVSMIMGAVETLKGEKSTPHDADINSCGLCGCELRAAVWFPLEAQQYNMTDEMRQQFNSLPYCWKTPPEEKTQDDA